MGKPGMVEVAAVFLRPASPFWGRAGERRCQASAKADAVGVTHLLLEGESGHTDTNSYPHPLCQRANALANRVPPHKGEAVNAAGITP